MFEIRCIVGDKKLREVLVFLNSNNTLEPPVVIPVGGINAAEVVKKVTVQQPKIYKKRRKPIHRGGKHLKGKGSTQVVRDFIERTGVHHITARDMKTATVSAGYSPNAYSHAVKLLLKDGSIKPTKEVGVYQITPKKAFPHMAAEDSFNAVVGATN